MPKKIDGLRVKPPRQRAVLLHTAAPGAVHWLPNAKDLDYQLHWSYHNLRSKLKERLKQLEAELSLHVYALKKTAVPGLE